MKTTLYISRLYIDGEPTDALLVDTKVQNIIDTVDTLNEETGRRFEHLTDYVTGLFLRGRLSGQKLYDEANPSNDTFIKIKRIEVDV